MNTDLALSIESMCFSFSKQSNAFALKISSLEIAKGERVALIGPSGSGKSTLLGLVCGVLTPQTGTVNVLGNRLEKMSSRQRDKFRAEKLGVIFQQFNLLPYLSVLDNVVLALEFSNKRNLKTAEKRYKAQQLLKSLGINSESLTQRTATQLSVGQQQRVAAARAFVGNPTLIIADEPTSALDEERQSNFLELLFDQQQQNEAALLVVTHDSRVAGRFDRVINLLDICDYSATSSEPT